MLKIAKDASFPLLNYAEMNFCGFSRWFMKLLFIIIFKKSHRKYLVKMDTNNMNDALINTHYSLFQ